MSALTAREITDLLELEPLPSEGGFFRQTYRAKTQYQDRPVSTAIYYLVTPESFSALHRVPQDELFHFYLGDPVEMLQVTESGASTRVILGSDLHQGQRPQCLAPGGVWQGTRLKDGGKWALLGTTVSPGFEYSDFELASRSVFFRRFPDLKEDIIQFTHPEKGGGA